MLQVRICKKILLSLLLLFLVMQFFRPARNVAASPGGHDLAERYSAPPEVRSLLQTACYDCHSNTTRYPWYAEVQPVGWWLADHVRDAKAELNFSELGAASPKRLQRKLDAASDEVTDRTMPLRSYTLLHREARLTEAQRKLLTDWFDAVREQLPDQPAK